MEFKEVYETAFFQLTHTGSSEEALIKELEDKFTLLENKGWTCLEHEEIVTFEDGEVTVEWFMLWERPVKDWDKYWA